LISDVDTLWEFCGAQNSRQAAVRDMPHDGSMAALGKLVKPAVMQLQADGARSPVVLAHERRNVSVGAAAAVPE